MKLIASSLMLTLIASACQSNSNQKKAERRDTSVSVKKLRHASGCDTAVSNQEFSYGALAAEVFKADTGQVKSLFLDPVVLKMEQKTNSEGGTYYLHNFTDGVNRISLFRNGGFYVEEADIKNNRVRLNKKLSVGMRKEDILDLLKLKNSRCDTIRVTDDEFTFETDYIFKNARLQEVKMGQILE